MLAKTSCGVVCFSILGKLKTKLKRKGCPVSNELNELCDYVILFLQTLLQQGRADANALGRNSCTPLHLAAEEDNKEICKTLVNCWFT